MEEPDRYDVSSDQELSKTLHQLLVVNGEPSVTIQHPTDGERIIYRDEYMEMAKERKKLAGLSPARRLQEQKKIVRKKQMRFRTMMIDAKIHTVDIINDGNFGTDIEGNEIDVEGRTFLPIKQYLDGIQIQERELGCLLDESLARPPIRIRAEYPVPAE